MPMDRNLSIDKYISDTHFKSRDKRVKQLPNGLTKFNPYEFKHKVNVEVKEPRGFHKHNQRLGIYNVFFTKHFRNKF